MKTEGGIKRAIARRRSRSPNHALVVHGPPFCQPNTNRSAALNGSFGSHRGHVPVVVTHSLPDSPTKKVSSTFAPPCRLGFHATATFCSISLDQNDESVACGDSSNSR